MSCPPNVETCNDVLPVPEIPQTEITQCDPTVYADGSPAPCLTTEQEQTYMQQGQVELIPPATILAYTGSDTTLLSGIGITLIGIGWVLKRKFV